MVVSEWRLYLWNHVWTGAGCFIDSDDGEEGQSFVHVFDWPRGPLEINGLQERVLSAYLVAGGQPLKLQESEGKLRIELPSQLPAPNASVTKGHCRKQAVKLAIGATRNLISRPVLN